MSVVADPGVVPLRVHHSFHPGAAPPDLHPAHAPGSQRVDGELEHLRLHHGDHIVGCVTFAATEASDVGARAGIDATRLANTFVVGPVWVEDAQEGHPLALALYIAMRRQRMRQRTHYVALVDRLDCPLVQLLRATPIRDASQIAVHGRIDEAMLRCFERLSETERDEVRGSGFVEEIRAVVMTGVQAFVASPFFEAARAGTLTQAQYVHATANNHLFARYTTRILGMAVAACDDPGLRAHFADHLSGEVNHELWLEQDLAYLDADVDYVKHRMVPDAPIVKFNLIQEAMVAFRRDPVVFMAVPIVIEGVAAFLPPETIEALRSCIRSWGYDRPKLGTRFLASHVHTDGGHDTEHEGHWHGTLGVMKDYVRTERQQQQILRIMELVFDALHAAYAGYVAGPAL